MNVVFCIACGQTSNHAVIDFTNGRSMIIDVMAKERLAEMIDVTFP